MAKKMVNSKESVRSLMSLLGMDPDEGKLPKKWDGSYISHSHYLNKALDDISDAGHRSVAIGEHVFTPLPEKPVRVLLTGGGAVAGGTDLEELADYNSRLTDYRFEYNNIVKSNDEYKIGVTYIIDAVKKVINTSTLDQIRELANDRQAPEFIDAFADMGNTTNPSLSFTAKKNLLEANFIGCEISIIKAVIDQVRNVVNANNGPGNNMPDMELKTFLLEKALQSDDSIDKNKYNYTVSSIEADTTIPPITYAASYTRLKLASDTYDAKNTKDNIVDHTLLRYNDSQKITNSTSEKVNFTQDKNSNSPKEKCLACGKNHSIEKCNSNYPCAVVKGNTHKITDKCSSSNCEQPKEKLKQYLEFIDAIKNKKNTKIKTTTKMIKDSNTEEDKPSKKQKVESHHKAIESANQIEVATALSAIQSTLETLISSTKKNQIEHANLSHKVDRMGSNFNEFMSDNANSANGRYNSGLIRGNDNSHSRSVFKDSNSLNQNTNTRYINYGDYQNDIDE